MCWNCLCVLGWIWLATWLQDETFCRGFESFLITFLFFFFFFFFFSFLMYFCSKSPPAPCVRSQSCFPLSVLSVCAPSLLYRNAIGPLELIPLVGYSPLVISLPNLHSFSLFKSSYDSSFHCHQIARAVTSFSLCSLTPPSLSPRFFILSTFPTLPKPSSSHTLFENNQFMHGYFA